MTKQQYWPAGGCRTENSILKHAALHHTVSVCICVHWIVHWTLCSMCECIRAAADICNKYMCMVYNGIAAVAVMPSIQNWCLAFLFSCVCLLLLFSLFILSLCCSIIIFRTFVFSRFRVLFEYEMWTKMVVNAGTHTHICTHIFCTMPSHSIWLWFRCDANTHSHTFWLLLMRIHMASLGRIAHSAALLRLHFLLCERRFSVWKSKDKLNTIITQYCTK